MTERTKQKIEENLNLLCQDLGLDQSKDGPDQQKILLIYAALNWTAEDVREQCESQSKSNKKPV